MVEGMENIFEPILVPLTDVIKETPTIKTFVMRPDPPILFRAGQFMQLTVPGVGEAPFTPSSSPYEPEQMEITILKTGMVTDVLHQLKPGDIVGLRGPFGKGYPLEKFYGSENRSASGGKEILVVGGGVGLAPLRSLLLALFHDIDKVRRVSIKYGAKKPEELVYRRLFEQWSHIHKVDLTITIDTPAPGWTGNIGLVTELLKNLDIDLSNSYAVSCGPEIMLKFVTLTLLSEKFQPSQIYLSMNRNMSCGMGICGRCNVGPYYLCKDGPDMNYEKIKDIPYVLG